VVDSDPILAWLFEVMAKEGEEMSDDEIAVFQEIANYRCGQLSEVPPEGETNGELLATAAPKPVDPLCVECNGDLRWHITLASGGIPGDVEPMLCQRCVHCKKTGATVRPGPVMNHLINGGSFRAKTVVVLRTEVSNVFAYAIELEDGTPVHSFGEVESGTKAEPIVPTKSDALEAVVAEGFGIAAEYVVLGAR
jgi:hypothetical protein